MRLKFYKYHGAGNDFIVIDNRMSSFKVQSGTINRMCNRRFGIGADGLMLLENTENSDFYMRYFNSDGKESTMCGNGGRCMVAFANALGIIKGKTQFMASDGLHKANIIDSRTVTLQMKDIKTFETYGEDFYLDTGSPHYVRFVDDISSAPVYNDGKQVRHDKRFAPGGTNVNFVQVDKDLNLSVRSYERGVENETLACGTGIVASAIATYLNNKTDKTSFLINAVGGKLKVHFDPFDENKFRNVWLTGPVEFVFAGEIEI